MALALGSYFVCIVFPIQLTGAFLFPRFIGMVPYFLLLCMHWLSWISIMATSCIRSIILNMYSHACSMFPVIPAGVTKTPYSEPSGCWSSYRVHLLYLVVLAMECLYARCFCILFVGQNLPCFGVCRNLLSFSFTCDSPWA